MVNTDPDKFHLVRLPLQKYFHLRRLLSRSQHLLHFRALGELIDPLCQQMKIGTDILRRDLCHRLHRIKHGMIRCVKAGSHHKRRDQTYDHNGNRHDTTYDFCLYASLSHLISRPFRYIAFFLIEFLYGVGDHKARHSQNADA